jgi:uncharacterized protein YjbI with pentapeptide repeats
MANDGGPAGSRLNVAPRWLKALWGAHPLVVLTGLAIVALAVSVALIWPVTDLIAAHDVGLLVGPKRAAALQTARAAVRTQLLTLGAGVFAAGALVYTARNFTLSRRTVELTQLTFQLAEQGQVTDRYTKAIEQLGSDKLEVTIGGIYALERIARDSPRDHPTIMEVLAAFMRERSRRQVTPPEPGDNMPPHATRPDVNAAITVFGRRDLSHDRMIVDLTQVDLTRVDLAQANLCAILNGANLTGASLFMADCRLAQLNNANLAGAFLRRADFSQASLRGADLTGADLLWASLTNAELGKAILTGLDLSGLVDLTGARFEGAHLAGADFSGTNLKNVALEGADLTGADFRNADLTGIVSLDIDEPTGADFSGAKYREGIPVPAGWLRDPPSGRLQRVSEKPDGGS